MEPTVIIGPVTEPITAEEAKAQSRIDSNAELDLLSIYISAARAWYEWRTGMTIHEQTLEWTPDAWSMRGFYYPPQAGYLELPRATPLIEVVSFEYKDSYSLEITWPTSSYVVDTDSRPGRIYPAYGESWPDFDPYRVSPIRIQYRAGIAITSPPTAETPNDIKYPILLLVAGMYKNRESIIVSDRAQISQVALQYGVEHFIPKHTSVYVF